MHFYWNPGIDRFGLSRLGDQSLVRSGDAIHRIAKNETGLDHRLHDAHHVTDARRGNSLVVSASDHPALMEMVHVNFAQTQDVFHTAQNDGQNDGCLEVPDRDPGFLVSKRRDLDVEGKLSGVGPLPRLWLIDLVCQES